jgi:hypothetical protein
VHRSFHPLACIRPRGAEDECRLERGDNEENGCRQPCSDPSCHAPTVMIGALGTRPTTEYRRGGPVALSAPSQTLSLFALCLAAATGLCSYNSGRAPLSPTSL